MGADRDSHIPENGPHRAKHGSNGTAAAPESASTAQTPDHAAENESRKLDALLKQFRELRENAWCYAAAMTDSVKLSLRNAVLWVVLAALGFVAVSCVFVLASWFLLSGMAQGLGALFGDRLWIGMLMTGVLVLVALVIGIYTAIVVRNKISRQRTIDKYESRQARNKATSGRAGGDQEATRVPEKK